MSGPAHVGECPVMTWTLLPNGDRSINQPWESLTVIDDGFFDLIPLRDMKRRADGMAIELTLRAANGWAQYRRVGRDNAGQRSVWELVEGWYFPSARGPEGR